MDDHTLIALSATAAFLGFFHTITGPDHYVPFIAMAKVGDWSLRRTAAVTAACGVGHVLASIVLGAVGLGIGLALTELTWLEGARGNAAAWLLFGFGLAYMAWGIRRAIVNRPHAHVHAHADGTIHYHKHTHEHQHAHVHESSDGNGRMTPWILFAIFVFGPCEPLIPLLMYPAAELNLWGVLVVSGIFGVVTLTIMLSIVMAGRVGLACLSLPWLERYSHAAAGGAIAACGLAIHVGL